MVGPAPARFAAKAIRARGMGGERQRGLNFQPIGASVSGFMVTRAFASGLVLVTTLWVAGCGDPKVAVYRVPKEADPVPQTPGPPNGEMPAASGPVSAGGGGMAGTPVATASGPSLAWTAPSTWISKPPGAMRKATYGVPGAGGEGDLSITAFPGESGGELANINRWRGQIMLPPLPAADLPSATTHFDSNGLSLTFVDLAPASAGGQRILGAIVPWNGSSWFFKLTGPDALVVAAKPDFTQFLKTIRPPEGDAAAAEPPAGSPISGAATGSGMAGPAAGAAAVGAGAAATGGGSMASMAVPTAGGPPLEWTAPSDWRQQTASVMRKGSYAVPGAGGEADLSITAFSGEVGGELANVNRWRGQVGLAPLAESELASTITRLNSHGLTLSVVDLASGTGLGDRIVAAIVPYNGATWFFKLTGPNALVSAAKPKFLEFLGTVHAP